MLLSSESVETLRDLIENRLAVMSIADQDDLREKLKLQRALGELRPDIMTSGMLKGFTDIPRRGRRRKVSTMVGEGH